MTRCAVQRFANHRRTASAILTTGIVLAVVVDVIFGTVLTFARSDMIGDLHAGTDQFTGLIIVYTAAKVIAFAAAPWTIGQIGGLATLRLSVCLTALLGAAAAAVPTIWAQYFLQAAIGLTGGAILVAGQAILLQVFPRKAQIGAQGLFALASVAGPAALAPAAEGWLIVNMTWPAVYAVAAATALAALGVLHMTRLGARTLSQKVRFDVFALVLLTTFAVCAVYVLTQGTRFSWLDTGHIVALSAMAVVAALMLIARLLSQAPEARFIDLTLFRDVGFALGFFAGSVAGFALFGSAYLIGVLGGQALGFDPVATGALLLPSAGAMVAGLAIVSLIAAKTPAPPIVAAPLGSILLIVSV